MTWFRRISKRRYETVAPLRFRYGTPDAGIYLEVPEGFAFDVSIPRWIWWLFDPRDGRFLEAAALHDFALLQGWPREAAAAPFGHALRNAGVSRIKRLAMVLGVTIWKWR